jgi:hypothetical protein
MVTGQKSSGGVFDQISIDNEQRKKLEDLDSKRMKISEENKKDLSQYDKSIREALKGNKAINMEDLSKLDKGIARGKEYNKEITDLAESLTTELTDMGQFLGDMSNYQGFEKLVSKLSSRWADKMRLGRVKNADNKANLQTILTYGHYMVEKLYNTTLENMDCYSQLEASITNTAEKLEENQPLYEKFRAEKEKLQKECQSLQDLIDKADQTEYSKLAGQKAILDKKLQVATTNENYHFTIVDTAKQALPVQKTHMKAYADIVDSLTQMKTRLEQNIENVTTVYLSAPVAIKTALSTKAAATYDKGMKYATDRTTDAVLKSAEGIMDETMNRAEKPLLDPEQLALYKKMQMEMRANFDKRSLEIKEKYAKPSNN